MVLITGLPPEIIHNILTFVDPADLVWIPRVCTSFHYSVAQNKSLFKHVYLGYFDTPENHDIDFEHILKDWVRLQVVCRRKGVENKKHELSFVYDTVTELLKHATPNGPRASAYATHPLSRNATLLAQLFSDYENQHAFLGRSFLYERARAELPVSESFSSPPKDEHQKSAKLHCLYGVPLLYAQRGSHETRSGKMSPFACSRVYDIRQYNERTKWGPFMDDDTDRVDWERVEAIMLVLGANLKRLGLSESPICKSFLDTPFAGVWPQSYTAHPINREESDPLDLQDPYGVTGTWLRVVCFLDYCDFFAFNFGPGQRLPPNVPRQAIDVDEVTRLILMKIHVVKIEPAGPENGQALPVVHFKGVSKSLDDSWDENANSDLRGTVRLTRDGEVRWTSFSVFSGEERWRSESVQVGGVKSAKGVLGNWFDT
ncbi:uncharacterized protein BCR38DRAFT_432883 [Pseudomassariella vexata]|uniref:F-box domain-containing protein n=1 Tax=Pseudomassariella vexata TaxID=1141098 RepID=A0A1Y2E1P1_9PEZI|nr:uncharacterized protein BCR38DRAFT_432883 [Pseudomassariella vexata]ORY65473.1 hypothetical protein BCR38DRAFT_432883 [Pseudomassariella vexata]